MHFTQSLDLGVVLNGTVELGLPEDVKADLGPGDSLVMRGNLHSLNNKSSSEWCRILFVVMHSKKITFGDGKGVEGLEFP